MFGESIGTVMAASAVWLLLTLVALVHAAGGSFPIWLEVLCGATAAPVALAAAVYLVAGYWRGPAIQSFPAADSEACTPDEASHVRLVSQLHGTMGGAGYLHPARLLLPVLAWLVAAAEGVLAVLPGVEPWVFGALATAGLAGACAAVLLPARAYFYREATGGCAVVSPPAVARVLRRRAAAAQALATGRPVDPSSPTPVHSAGLSPSGATPRDGAR